MQTLRDHPIFFRFFALAYALSWWPWFTSGGTDTILPLGPLVAALIMLTVIGGWPGVKEFLSRIANWCVAPNWYLFVLGLPMLVAALAVALNLGRGATIITSYSAPPVAELAGKFAFVFLFIGLGEEPAWRGYALPRLMVSRTTFVAAMITGVLHAVWHWPLFGIEYYLNNIVPWFLSVMAFSVLTAWAVNRTGALLLPALFHTMVNTSAFVFGMFAGGDLLWLWWLFGALWLASAAIVLWRSGAELGRPAAP